MQSHCEASHSTQSTCLCILSAYQAAEQVKLQCSLFHNTAVDHSEVVPGITSSVLALQPDTADPTKLVQHMSALRRHACIHVAAVVHCVFSAVVSTATKHKCGLLSSHALQVEH